MSEYLRCVGYVKNTAYIELDMQKKHIQEYAGRNNITLTRIYTDENMNDSTAFSKLYEDAMHRRFDVLVVDSAYCFGRNIHSASCFITNVLLHTGFRVVFLDMLVKDIHVYLQHCAMQSKFSGYGLGHKNKKKSEKAAKLKIEYPLSWYEDRQKEIFNHMLNGTGDFMKLETELRECRKIIKKLKEKGDGKKKQT